MAREPGRSLDAQLEVPANQGLAAGAGGGDEEHGNSITIDPGISASGTVMP